MLPSGEKLKLWTVELMKWDYCLLPPANIQRAKWKDTTRQYLLAWGVSLSITGQISDSTLAAQSTPPQVITIPHEAVRRISTFPRHFLLPRAPYCCHYKPVAPLLEPCQQPGGFWLRCPNPAHPLRRILWIPHSASGKEGWPTSRNAQAYTRTQHCTDTQTYSINSCLLL